MPHLNFGGFEREHVSQLTHMFSLAGETFLLAPAGLSLHLFYQFLTLGNCFLWYCNKGQVIL